MVSFRRVAEAFDVVAKVRDCDSSGSEHSAETMKDLSDLVNSYIENGDGVVVNSYFDTNINDECNSDEIDDDHTEEIKESLKKLFRTKKGDAVRKNLIFQVDKAWRRVTKDSSSTPAPEYKRLLMARLRDQGFDAGLCKSKWEKKGRLISGDHQYVDVNVAGTRYIVTVSLAEEFETARPTENYTSLLEILSEISVCKVEEMKEVVRIMCRAVKKTMSQRKMAVPPWKRREYVQAKWFSAYKRTTNEFSTKHTADLNENEKKIEGFSWTPESFYCRHNEDFGRKEFGLRMGNLAMVMNGAS